MRGRWGGERAGFLMTRRTGNDMNRAAYVRIFLYIPISCGNVFVVNEKQKIRQSVAVDSCNKKNWKSIPTDLITRTSSHRPHHTDLIARTSWKCFPPTKPTHSSHLPILPIYLFYRPRTHLHNIAQQIINSLL